MNPDELKMLSGVLALVHQMFWQVRIGLIDRQARSAFLFLLITAAIMVQLAASYMGGPRLGNTDRGVMFFFLWVGSLVWWSFCTLHHNAVALKKMREARKQHKDVSDKLRRPLGGFRE